MYVVIYYINIYVYIMRLYQTNFVTCSSFCIDIYPHPQIQSPPIVLKAEPIKFPGRLNTGYNKMIIIRLGFQLTGGMKMLLNVIRNRIEGEDI